MEQIFVLVGGLLIFAAIIALYTAYTNGSLAALFKGKKFVSAKALCAMCKRFAVMQGYKSIGPCTFVKGDKTASADMIIVGYFGVFAVKSIGIGGEIYGEANSAQWLHVATDGTRQSFDNPLTECALCARLIREALFVEKINNINVECIAVFINKKASIAVPKSCDAMPIKAFKKLLEKSKYLEDKGIDVEKATAAILNAVK